MMKNIFIIILLSFVLSALKVFSQGRNHSYMPDANGSTRECNVKYKHMILDVRFQPEKGKVLGKVNYYFNSMRSKVDSIWLDAPGIEIKSVKCSSLNMKNTEDKKHDLNFKTNAEGVSIFFANPLLWDVTYNIEVEYEATPRRGIYFIGWDDSTNRLRKQIWTQGEGIDNRHWIPAHDEFNTKLITEVYVHFDKKYKVLANGSFLGKSADKNDFVWHYKMQHPHGFYLTMLGIGEYDIADEKSSSGVPLHHWYYPDKKETLEPTYRYTARIMDILEKEAGVPYPWESYSQIPVQNFLYGAMENTTATIFGDFFCVDKRTYHDRNYVAVNAHEMAHQWFGDLVTARNPRDMWLQESFATYYSKMALKNIYGTEHYQWSCRGEMNSALGIGKENALPIMHTGAGSPRIYQKGSFTLGMLKYVVGEAEYNRVVAYYLKKHAYGMVDTHDFMQAFHDVLGVNLEWFFDEWLWRGGEPAYKVSYKNITELNGKKSTQVVVQQTHTLNETVDYFNMPIVFEVCYKDGSSATVKEIIKNQEQVVYLPNKENKEVDFVLFDPGCFVLKTVSFDKSFEELQAQVLRAKNMIDRYDALTALKNISLDKKRDLLYSVFRNEKFYAMKTEVISQLSGDEMSESFITKSFSDNEAEVRLASLNAVKKITSKNKDVVFKLLKDSSNRVVEAALGKLCEYDIERTPDYLQECNKIYGIGNSVRITWIKYAKLYYNKHGVLDEKYMDELVDYSSAAFEFRTRINAFNALKSLNYLDKKSALSLMDAICSNNSRLAGPAAEVIAYFKAQDKYKKELKEYFMTAKWTEKQKEVILKNIE